MFAVMPLGEEFIERFQVYHVVERLSEFSWVHVPVGRNRPNHHYAWFFVRGCVRAHLFSRMQPSYTSNYRLFWPVMI